MKVKLVGTSKLEFTKDHYVYGLIDPRNSTLFYVGQAYSHSKKPRYLQHFLTVTNKMQNPEKHRVIQEIKSQGYSSLLYFLFFETNCKQEAIDKEIELIEKYKPQITNISKGGIGGAVWGTKHPLKGKSFSAEWKLKLSMAKKGKPSPRKGSKLSDATKEKIRRNTILQNATNPPRLIKTTDEQENQILFYRKFNYGRRKISKITGISPHVIKRILNNHGINC